MLMDLVSIMANHGLQLPSDLLLLIRAFVTLEGLGRSLDPSFNMAVEVAPFVERLVKERYSARRIFERASADAKELLQTAHDLPLQAREIFRKLAEDDLQVNFEHRGLDRLIHEFDRSSNRVVVGVITGSLQAYIFTLLTIIYLAGAVHTEHGHDDAHHDDHHAHGDSPAHSHAAAAA